MDPTDLLAKIYDAIDKLARQTKRYQRASIGLILSVISAAAFLTELIGATEFFSPILNSNIRLEQQLDQVLIVTGADRALLCEFEEGDRVCNISRAGGAKLEVVQANRRTSISVYPYSELYAAHKRGQCWVYKYDPADTHILADGMRRVGAKVLISCPVFNTQGVLVGAVSISFDYALDPETIEEYKAILKQAAVELRGML